MDTNKEVISKLKFISCINGGEKINVRYMYVQQNDIATKFSRTLYNKDNRKNTLTFIRDTINRSFEIIKTYKNSELESERIICSHIMLDLKDAIKGILNLKETYIDDIKFCCDIQTIIQEIEAKLLELENLKNKTIKVNLISLEN